MLPLILLRTVNGPIPTLFTGDLAHVAQFIQDLDRFVWKNRNHPLISTPWTRIDLALAFISGPTTLAWRRSIRCGRTTEVTTDTLWNDFLESFCETWVYSPEATTPVIAPEMPTSPAVPSPLPAAAPTLKRVDDILIVFTADELPPRHLSETIDQTADEDDADDGPSFAPCTSAPPPRNPRRPFSPRLASPVASILDSVKPVNEQPPPPRSACRSASPIVPVTTRDESSDPPLPLIETPDLSTTASAAQRAEDRPVATPIKVDHGETLVTSPHASNGTARKRKHKTDDEDDTRPGKRIHAQLARRRIPLPRKCRYVQRRPAISPPPVDDSSGIFTPARLHPSSPSAQLTTPRRSPSHLRLPSRPVSPPVLSPLYSVLRDEGLKRAIPTSTLALCPRPSATVSPTPQLLLNQCSLPRVVSLTYHSLPSSTVLTPSPASPLGLTLATDELPPNQLPVAIDLTSDVVDNAADAILFPSRLPSPFLVPAPSSALPPTSIVEDDNDLRRGVKTLGASVFTPDFVVSPVTTSPMNNLDSSIEASNSPTQHQNQRNVATPTTKDDDRTLFAPRHPVTPATVPVSPSADHVHNKQTPHDDAPMQPQSPRHPHIFPPEACERPHDLDKSAAESAHAQPRQARSRQTPRPTDHRIKDKRPPDALTKRWAVTTFLKNYDAARTVQKPTPTENNRAYDAVARHLDQWLWMTDRPYQSHPFHVVVQHATLGPRQSRTTKTSNVEPQHPSRLSHSKRPQTHSPDHVREMRVSHALMDEERHRYLEEGQG
ncbi:hypothetical protein EDB85DRAFT_2172392 [Lactarius pseudohatsudake]|nr:hypothetical protein EDB85DRAFT_2172392 [Lactarius pseudohatsudake]